jgi:hypothetical protein
VEENQALGYRIGFIQAGPGVSLGCLESSGFCLAKENAEKDPSSMSKVTCERWILSQDRSPKVVKCSTIELLNIELKLYTEPPNGDIASRSKTDRGQGGRKDTPWSAHTYTLAKYLNPPGYVS